MFSHGRSSWISHLGGGKMSFLQQFFQKEIYGILHVLRF